MYFVRLGVETSYADLPRGVAWLNDSTLVASCANGKLRVIPVDGGKEKNVSVGKTMIDATVVSPDRSRIVAGLSCIDAKTWKKAWSTKRPFLGAAFLPDGATLIASFNFGVSRVDARDGTIHDDLEATSHHHSGSIEGVSVSPDGEFLVTGCNSGIVASTRLSTGEVVAANNLEGTPAHVSMQFSVTAVAHGRDRVAVALDGDDIRIVSPDRLELRRTLPIPASEGTDRSVTSAVAFANDGATLFATCLAKFPNGQFTRTESFLMAWNTETGAELLRAPAPSGVARRALSLGRDARKAAIGCTSGVYVVDLPSL